MRTRWKSTKFFLFLLLDPLCCGERHNLYLLDIFNNGIFLFTQWERTWWGNWEESLMNFHFFFYFPGVFPSSLFALFFLQLLLLFLLVLSSTSFLFSVLYLFKVLVLLWHIPLEHIFLSLCLYLANAHLCVLFSDICTSTRSIVLSHVGALCRHYWDYL